MMMMMNLMMLGNTWTIRSMHTITFIQATVVIIIRLGVVWGPSFSSLIGTEDSITQILSVSSPLIKVSTINATLTLLILSIIWSHTWLLSLMISYDSKDCILLLSWTKFIPWIPWIIYKKLYMWGFVPCYENKREIVFFWAVHIYVTSRYCFHAQFSWWIGLKIAERKNKKQLQQKEKKKKKINKKLQIEAAAREPVKLLQFVRKSVSFLFSSLNYYHFLWSDLNWDYICMYACMSVCRVMHAWMYVYSCVCMRLSISIHIIITIRVFRFEFMDKIHKAMGIFSDTRSWNTYHTSTMPRFMEAV